MEGRRTFGIEDYCLFAVTLAVSAGIGLFFAVTARMQKQKANDLFTGGGQMLIIPTALSLTVSFLSGVSLLAVPVEIYMRGILMYINRLVGTLVATLVGIGIVLPILFEIRPVSVYEYFERRFHSKFLRKAGAALYLLFMLFYMSIVLYAPAVAMSGATGIKPWIFYVVVGLVCSFYTSFGGLKAVVWTDTFQAVCMFGGLIAITVKGTIDSGGPAAVHNASVVYQRISSAGNVELDPFQYNTLWTSTLGGVGLWFTLLTFNQISVQRYFSMGSLDRAQIVLGVTFPGYLVLMFVCDMVGLVMFAFYLGCDPLRSRSVDKGDQLVIRFALDAVGEYKGLPGVFLACLFSGTLSTISSGINSMSAVLWEDFLSERFPNMDERKKVKVVTAIALCFGFIAIGMAGLAEPLGGILSACLSVMGSIGGPICGLFLLGMLCPQANRYGAATGLVISILVTCWIAIGSVVVKPYKKFALELPVDKCPANATERANFINFDGPMKPRPNDITFIYTLSSYIFPFLGLLLVILVGWPASLCFNDKEARHKASERLEEKNGAGTTGRPPRLCIWEFFGDQRESKPNPNLADSTINGNFEMKFPGDTSRQRKIKTSQVSPEKDYPAHYDYGNYGANIKY